MAYFGAAGMVPPYPAMLCYQQEYNAMPSTASMASNASVDTGSASPPSSHGMGMYTHHPAPSTELMWQHQSLPQYVPRIQTYGNDRGFGMRDLAPWSTQDAPVNGPCFVQPFGQLVPDWSTGSYHYGQSAPQQISSQQHERSADLFTAIHVQPVEDVKPSKPKKDCAGQAAKLLAGLKEGKSYDHMKAEYNFEESISTLRGRVRTYKRPEWAGKRRPTWTKEDTDLLEHFAAQKRIAARRRRPSEPARPDAGRTNRRVLKCGDRIPWKLVAEELQKRASYPYGPASCSSRWAELHPDEMLDTRASE